MEAKGENFLQEIDNLHQRQLITISVKEWAHTMPQLLGEVEASSEQLAFSAKELLRFCRYFLDMLFTLPHDAHAYHKLQG